MSGPGTQRALARAAATATTRDSLPPLNVLGIMSGTSMDGADAVLARLELKSGALVWEVMDRESLPYPAEMRRRLHASLKPETSDVLTLTELHAEVGELYAGLAAAVAARGRVDLVALSGQTVYHIPRVEPERGWSRKATLQIGEAALTLERLGVPVVCDFRQGDFAAGGEGAPMVSFGDSKLFPKPGVNRSVHNLGGISNLTLLPADQDPAGVVAFDTGPANCLIDEACERLLGVSYDEDGRIAASGSVDRELLDRLMSHPYLALPAPKTTGREVFTLDVILAETNAGELAAALAPRDLVATLTAYTAESIARAYRELLPVTVDEVLVAGGGALNPTLLAALQALMPAPVTRLDSLGVDACGREALAFAVMAYYAVHARTNTLPGATGARHAVVAGKLLRPPAESAGNA